MEKKRVIQDVTGLPQMKIPDFGPRAYAEADALAEKGIKYVLVPVLSPASFYSSLGFDLQYLSIPSLQKEGLVREKLVPVYKKKEAMHEAYQNYGLQYDLASFCFLDWVRTDVTAEVFASVTGTTDWKKWPGEMEHFPEEGSFDLKPYEDQMLEAGFRRFIIGRQWQQLHRYARTKHVSLIGQIPFCEEEDSAAGWWNPSVYKEKGYAWTELMKMPSVFTDYILSAGKNYDGLLLKNAQEILSHQQEFKSMYEVIHRNSPELLLLSVDPEVMSFLQTL